MKNFRILMALLITILFLNFKSSAQATTAPAGDLLFIRIYEGANSLSYMIISYGNGKIEEVPLGNIGLNSKTARTNVDTISSVLTRVMKDGYSLLSSTGGASGNILVTTYIFAKN